ncbi:MAG: cytochrome c [Chloroflexi bacterium]|nr:cytochrome c [Chloroflexota bacterium]
MPSTAMPAFGAMFKDEDVWYLVNYLHQLADAAKQGAGMTPTPVAVPGARGR